MPLSLQFFPINILFLLFGEDLNIFMPILCGLYADCFVVVLVI